jgi:hypothetical protein
MTSIMTIENKLPKFTAKSSLFHTSDFNNSYTLNIQTNDMSIIPQDRTRYGHCVGYKAVTIKAFGKEQTCDKFDELPYITQRTNGDIDSGCGHCIF